MAAGINVKASIDGAAKFREDLKTMTARSKALDAEMKEMTNRFEKDGKAMGDNAKQRELSSKQIEAQKQKIELLTDRLKKLEQAGQGETQEAYKLREQIAKANTELTNMEHATEGASNASSGFSLSLGKMALGVGTAVVAVKAAVSAIKSIANAAGNAAKAVWNLGVESGKWADELITLSAQTGVDVETLQEWGYAARFIDTEVSTMTKGMTKLTKAYAKGASSKKKMVKLAKGVTVSLKDENGQIKSQSQFFLDTIDALHGMTNEAQRNKAAQEIFGKSYTDLLPLINSGTQAIREYSAEARDMGVIISGENVGALGGFDDQMQRLSATFDAIKTNLAVAFLPILELVSGRIVEFSGKVSKALEDGFQPEDVKTIIDAFFDMFKVENGDQDNEASKMSEFIGAIAAKLKEAVSAHEEDIKGIATKIFTFIGDGFKEALGITGLKEKLFGEEGTFLGFKIEEGSVADNIIKGWKYIVGLFSKDTSTTEASEKAGEGIADDFASGIKGNQQPVSDAADDTIGTVEEHAGGPSAHSKSTHWGNELADGYAAGIEQGIPKVSAAARKLAAAASGPIHFSKPDYGPLRNIGAWGGEMIEQYVAGIRANAWKVSNALGSVLGVPSVSPVAGGSTTNLGGVTIVVNGAAGQDVNELADIVMAKMQNAVSRREAVFA